MKKIISILLVGIMSISLCACGSNGSGSKSTSNSQNNEAEASYYAIDETALAVDGKYELTLKSFDYVEDVYEGGYVSTSVESFTRTTPNEENCLIRVIYTLKNVGKEAENIGTAFGYLEFDDGYKFSSDKPVGIHLVVCGGSTSKVLATTTLQPLSDAVEVVAFLEVPKAVKEDEVKPLFWSFLGETYKIR